MKKCSILPDKLIRHSRTACIIVVTAALCGSFFFSISCTTSKKIKPGTINRYTPPDAALYATIAHQDSLMFIAFNGRKLDQLMAFFSDRLELYQDNTGVRNYTETREAFKGLFERDYVLTRTLEPGSLEVYPIKGYGAIETGKHTFCHTENGKLDCGTFKFLHVWELKNGQWKITRLITYDHKL